MEDLKGISMGLMELFWKEVANIVERFRKITLQEEIKIQEIIK